jgi:hypothetical protein
MLPLSHPHTTRVPDNKRGLLARMLQIGRKRLQCTIFHCREIPYPAATNTAALTTCTCLRFADIVPNTAALTTCTCLCFADIVPFVISRGQVPPTKLNIYGPSGKTDKFGLNNLVAGLRNVRESCGT